MLLLTLLAHTETYPHCQGRSVSSPGMNPPVWTFMGEGFQGALWHMFSLRVQSIILIFNDDEEIHSLL